MGNFPAISLTFARRLAGGQQFPFIRKYSTTMSLMIKKGVGATGEGGQVQGRGRFAVLSV